MSTSKYKLIRVILFGGLLLLAPVAMAKTPNDNQIAENIGTLAVIAHYFALVAGLSMMVGGIFKIKRYSEARTMMSQQHTITTPLIMIVAGSALLAFPTIIHVLMEMFWGAGNTNDLPVAWASTLRMKPVVYFIRFLGLVSFIRGCITFSKHQADSQQGVIGKGMMYLFSGICLMHIVGLVTFINNNFIGL
jgi:hypothetical protein